MRRLAGVGVGAMALVLVTGAGPASAGDQHSGGESPEVGGVDLGRPSAEVLGDTTEAGGGGLPITGGDIAAMTVIGGAAVAVGCGAVATSRRRSRLST